MNFQFNSLILSIVVVIATPQSIISCTQDSQIALCKLAIDFSLYVQKNLVNA